jgi:hypothetical protein
MSQYFDHSYASNSDLKRFMNEYVYQKKQMENVNLDVIFEQGTLNHHALTEPHKADRTHKDYDLAVKMASTVLKDDLCRRVIMMKDFRREHEWYRQDVYGIRGRCKADGDSKALKVCFEYKGLGLTTDKAFEEALFEFDYDQGAAWYLNTMQYDLILIAAVSKKQPDRLFKRIIDRNHKIFQVGDQKCIKATTEWSKWFNQN